MSDLPQKAVEAAHAELVYPIGIVRCKDGGRSITRFALEAAAPFIRAQERERLRGELLSDKAIRAAREGHGDIHDSFDESGLVDAFEAALDSLAPEPVEETLRVQGSEVEADQKLDAEVEKMARRLKPEAFERSSVADDDCDEREAARKLARDFLTAPIMQPGHVYVEHDNEDHTGEWMDGEQVNALRRDLRAPRNDDEWLCPDYEEEP